MDIGPLYAAAIAGDADARIELERKADRLSTYDRTILHIESMNGNTERVTFILEEFAAKNLLVKIDSNKETALHLAAYHGHIEVVKVLLDAAKRLTASADDDLHNHPVSCYEAFVRQANRWMNTALHLALNNGNVGIAKLLVEADPSDRLIDAPKGEDNDIVEIICTTPSLVGQEITTDVPATSEEQKSFLSPSAYSDDGQNELHRAALKCDKDEILYIISSYEPKKLHFTLREKDRDGNTPLHVLFREGCFVPEILTHQNLDAITMIRNNHRLSAWDMLYLEEEIIGDQVKIFMTLIVLGNSRDWKFWKRNINRRMMKSVVWNSQDWKFRMMNRFWDSVVRPSKRAMKDVKFSEAKKELLKELRKAEWVKKKEFMKKNLERYMRRTNTQIIVTALIVTVTFTVAFTMPGGYHQDGEPDAGKALLSSKTAFKAFMVSDAIALVLSTSSLFLYFTASMYDDTYIVSILNAASSGLNIVSLMAMMFTFLAGTYVVLSDLPGLAIAIFIVTCFFFVLAIFLSIKMLRDLHRKLLAT